MTDNTEARSWASEVETLGSAGWAGNALRFATRTEAQDYGRELAGRWMLVTDWRAVASADQVNYRFDYAAARAVPVPPEWLPPADVLPPDTELLRRDCNHGSSHAEHLSADPASRVTVDVCDDCGAML